MEVHVRVKLILSWKVPEINIRFLSVILSETISNQCYTF